MKGSPEHVSVQPASYHVPSKSGFIHLEDILEDSPSSFPSPTFFPEPETPAEPIEFLSRSWSISALDVSTKVKAHHHRADSCLLTAASQHERPVESSPFVCAPSMTSQMVMDRIMEHSLFSAPRRNSHSSGPLICHNSGLLAGSPPPSPQQDDQAAGAARQMKGRSSVGRWFKDIKERKKEISRAHKAEVHAAVSMAGVAAAVAAVAAATAASNSDDSSKTSLAVASAASLVAAQCVDLAESMGADHEQISHVVSSAVNVKTAGDIMTLTAAAATALRGAATFKARTVRDCRNHAAVTPYEKHHALHSGDLTSEDGEAEFYTQEVLAKGAEFLKRSKKGELHSRFISVQTDPNGQVVVKVESKHLGLRKKRKGVVVEVDANIPAWPGRTLLHNGEQRYYFGLKIATGHLLEFECKTEYEHKLWSQGVASMLRLSKEHALALTTTTTTTTTGAAKQ